MSSRFERVILRCMAKHPDDRYASAAVLRTELEGLTSEARTTDTFGRAPAPSAEYKASLATPERRSRWPLAILALLVVLAVATVVVLLGR